MVWRHKAKSQYFYIFFSARCNSLLDLKSLASRSINEILGANGIESFIEKNRGKDLDLRRKYVIPCIDP